MLIAFASLILLPLSAAFLTARWAERSAGRTVRINRLAWFPVPLLAMVLFFIAATQVSLVMASIGLLGQLLTVFVAFLVVAAVIARILARLFRLPPSQGIRANLRGNDLKYR